MDHNKYRFSKDTVSLIKDFERVAKHHKGKIRFCVLVMRKDQVSRGLGHQLGVFLHTPLPTLRIMEFGEYLHVLEKRKLAVSTPNPKKQFYFKKKPKKKNKFEERKLRNKFVHKTRKERMEHDRPHNHPAHKNSKRDVRKFKSDDLSKEGMTKFVEDYLNGNTVHYHRADHVPKNNEKLVVRHLNSHNYKDFISKSMEDGLMPVIWACEKGARTYPDYFKQIKHLASQARIKNYFRFGKIDPHKNDHPKLFQGNKNLNKLFIYKDTPDFKKIWKIQKYEDMVKSFRFFMRLINELEISKMAQSDL